jgi:hypothetical protein
MSQEMVDAEVLEHKFVGPNFVIVRLPDGTECKLTVEVRAVKIKDQKNLDGTPMYNIIWNVLPAWKVRAGQVVRVPKPTVHVEGTNKTQDKRILT